MDIHYNSNRFSTNAFYSVCYKRICRWGYLSRSSNFYRKCNWYCSSCHCSTDSIKYS
uniref:Uncharacterized protein n=1 Tax=uncultured marine virus TaxID=186617 RepID=A0A0F7L9P5_9VIRU|nr:hypothetical protein [uncultured marine virus]